MKRELKKLRKQVLKYYWSHDQHLILDTWEMMEGKNDCSFDVHLADSDIFLFTIQNYRNFEDYDYLFISHFKENSYHHWSTFDGVLASCVPLYMNRTITLKHFKNITEKDIIQAAQYFVRRVLELPLTFNFKFKEKKDDRILENK